ncbi:MAG: 2-C-methyl-D-erythritol 4-phosphate cytidylyltransferase [Solirubrobacteraceae bacterium]|jgi:2-C-methyl-D-erythritol 4-phosphate cytidylyltransferase|nr:2-C-methyl-D-erythritol 4-phosphate cytidylyltransferase [Solirubrobacteraceae bacterium]
MAVALIVAAGRGERLGFGRPKALVPLCGRPMLEWSVDALRSVPAVEEIVIALPAEALHRAPPGTVPVAGGQHRSHSVRAALGASYAGGDPVIVHDAARPLARPRLFIAVLEELERYGADAVIAAAPVTDTIKAVGADGRTVTQTLDRSQLWAVQTPQVFRRGAIERALSAGEDQLGAATDDAWLVERGGGVVRIVSAEPANMKITTADDLRIAALLLSERMATQGSA